MEENLFYLGEMSGVSFPLDAIVESESTVGQLADKVLYVNIKTLLRNGIAAWADKDNVKGVLDHIYGRIEEDIMLLRNYLESNGTKVVVYNCQYNNLRLNSHVVLKTAKTEKQITLESVTKEALELVKPLIEFNYQTGQFTNSDSIRDSETYIITHIAYDLLDHGSFNKLILIESFTGELKTSSKFNSKLNIKKEYRSFIPFNKLSLMVFGDNELISPINRSIPKQLLELSKKYSWTPITTRSRMLFVLSRTDKALSDLISSISR